MSHDALAAGEDPSREVPVGRGGRARHRRAGVDHRPRARLWAAAAMSVVGAAAAITTGLGLGFLVSDVPPSAADAAGVATRTPTNQADVPQEAPAGPGTPSPWQEPVTPTAGATPVRVSAPAIELSADLVILGTVADGSMEVPSSTEDAGWLSGSSVPGATGPAVVAGHVDSTAGPAVFYRLGELVPGDAVDVLLSDGTSARFLVTSTVRAAKDQFPTDLVYGPAPDPQLRLITCGGEFDGDRRSYEDNVVVFARLA